jgi:hypothetical protein
LADESLFAVWVELVSPANVNVFALPVIPAKSVSPTETISAITGTAISSANTANPVRIDLYAFIVFHLPSFCWISFPHHPRIKEASEEKVDPENNLKLKGSQLHKSGFSANYFNSFSLERNKNALIGAENRGHGGIFHDRD